MKKIILALIIISSCLYCQEIYFKEYSEVSSEGEHIDYDSLFVVNGQDTLLKADHARWQIGKDKLTILKYNNGNLSFTLFNLKTAEIIKRNFNINVEGLLTYQYDEINNSLYCVVRTGYATSEIIWIDVNDGANSAIYDSESPIEELSIYNSNLIICAPLDTNICLLDPINGKMKQIMKSVPVVNSINSFIILNKKLLVKMDDFSLTIDMETFQIDTLNEKFDINILGNTVSDSALYYHTYGPIDKATYTRDIIFKRTTNFKDSEIIYTFKENSIAIAFYYSIDRNKRFHIKTFKPPSDPNKKSAGCIIDYYIYDIIKKDLISHQQYEGFEGIKTTIF